MGLISWCSYWIWDYFHDKGQKGKVYQDHYRLVMHLISISLSKGCVYIVFDVLKELSCVNLYNLLVKEPLFGLYHIERCLFLIWSSKGAKMC